jgi:hypothetical protein
MADATAIDRCDVVIIVKGSRVYRNVRRLQARIVKATQAKRWGKVKALQRLKLEVVKPHPEKGV